MDTQIQNIRRLIDSGVRENIALAAHLSVSLPDEWQWLHKHAKAMAALPAEFKSWHQFYAEVIKYNSPYIQIRIPTARSIPSKVKPWHTPGRETGYEANEYSIAEIAQNVATELHYMLQDVDGHTLYGEMSAIKALNQTPHTSVRFDRIGETTAMKLLHRILDMLPRR